MDHPLNENIERRARELARKITVAHDLDSEIQEELYGHIEDKLLAYKSGEERISDESPLQHSEARVRKTGHATTPTLRRKNRDFCSLWRKKHPKSPTACGQSEPTR